MHLMQATTGNQLISTWKDQIGISSKLKGGELFGPDHLLDSALNLVTDFVNNWKENSLNDSFGYLNNSSLMQYPNVEARNWRLAFKIIKRIFALFLSGALHLDGKQ